jgi:uncharacterized protein YndB with AHSA1/START domain
VGDYTMIFQVDADAPRDAVLQALTTEKGVNGWWTDRASVPTAAGATLEFTFPGMPQPFDMELVERGDSRIAWRSKGFPPFWAGTAVTWDLSDNPEGPGTRIDMRHSGWDPGNPALGIVTVGWGQILGHLKGFLESGTPQPFFTN